MVWPSLISVSEAPSSYFFSAAMALLAKRRPAARAATDNRFFIFVLPISSCSSTSCRRIRHGGELFPELPLDDLAAGGARQLLDADVDMDGQLERGEPRAQMFDHLLRGAARAGPCANHGADELAEHAIGNADDRGLDYIRMSEQGVLDLDAID